MHYIKVKSINQTNLEVELFLNLLFGPAVWLIGNQLPDGAWKTAFIAVILAVWLGSNIFLIRKNKAKGREKVFYIIRVAGFFLVTVLFFLFSLYI
ncbi:MAG: hypothetical protein LRY55_15330 [Leadbetterella sp.]|nr:hypothetical protein [Leadbetterella sp.]